MFVVSYVAHPCLAAYVCMASDPGGHAHRNPCGRCARALLLHQGSHVRLLLRPHPPPVASVLPVQVSAGSMTCAPEHAGVRAEGANCDVVPEAYGGQQSVVATLAASHHVSHALTGTVRLYSLYISKQLLSPMPYSWTLHVPCAI